MRYSLLSHCSQFNLSIAVVSHAYLLYRHSKSYRRCLVQGLSQIERHCATISVKYFKKEFSLLYSSVVHE